MESILITINIVLAVLLVIVILLQRSEGEALGLGVSQDNFTTTRSAGTFLTKFTSILATLFIITSVVLVSISHKDIKESQSVIDLEKEKEQNKNLPQIPENQKSSLFFLKKLDILSFHGAIHIRNWRRGFITWQRFNLSISSIIVTTTWL